MSREPDEAKIIFDLTDKPDSDALRGLRDGLVGFNSAEVGPSHRHALAIFLRAAPGGAVLGGLSGATAWGWLYVEMLWIAEALRGKGLARGLLTAAEAEAVRRGCRGAWIDTFNPAARTLYERQGYTMFGELPDFPPGRSRHFLKKIFSTIGSATPTPTGT